MNNKRNSKLLLNTNFLRFFLLAMVLTTIFQNYGIAQIPKENDRIGWSSDGNLADEDDWSATAMALAVFAKMGWQDKLVHFDYNNRLDRSLDWKEAENYESTIGGARRFGFNEENFFNDQRELDAAIEHAKEEINISHEGSKFWYVQAGPFEVAYQALLRANPEKRQYCILVSHSEVNEVPGKWKLKDGTPSHGKDDCVALGAKYFFTTNQYMEKFGGRRFKRWDLVEWMKNSPCDEYRWVHSRFLATAEHKDGGLDASDGGMAFALATGDLDGNFEKLQNFLGSDCSNSTTDMQIISIIMDADDEISSSKPVRWAVDQLQESLNQHGVKVVTYSALETAPDSELAIIVAGSKNALSQKILKMRNVSVSDERESLGLVQGNISGKKVLLACGSDAKGLMYAVLELADRIQCGIAPSVALRISKPIIEKPALKIRSIYRTFTSEVEDKPWYNDREFWKSYLSELAKQRINRFSLAFGMGYNSPTRCVDSYFFFAYPFLVEVPGYDVRALGLPDEERDSNLEMLRFISDEAAAHGMEFQLALWSHGYNFPENVNYKISGLTEENHATYCRDALALVLKTCPSITGVTYRVHKESGIPDGTKDFWEIVFDAHKQADHHVWIDMHGKSLTQDQLTWALETGMPVSASPKFVGEHMGLGYHPADIRHDDKGKTKEYSEPAHGVHLTLRKFTRAGYGDFLPEDREWRVLHRIWPGTNVLLLAGDPALAAGYSRSTNLLGSLGVERVDPLGFKGRKGTGYPGGRCAYADKSLEPEWDFQKFLYTYRVWGRLLYNPEADPDVWLRFLRSKFGDAAKSMEIALANSSRVVHLITTAHGAATDCTRFWPEMYTNQPIVNESDDVIFSDNPSPKVFGNVSPHDPQLFSKMNEFAAALLEGEELAKYSPLVVAQWLEDMADTATRNLNTAESLVEDKSDVEFRRFYHDIKIQCGIANFFAHKMRAAVLWHLYEGSGDTAALVEAIKHYTTAHDVWVKMAEDAKSIYVENVSFGDWVTQSGHWIDRIPRIDSDIADMKEALAKAKANGNKSSQQKSVSTAIQRVKSRPQLPTMNCQHTPAKNFQPGKPMKIELELTREAKGVDLYYRHVNQAVEWQVVRMDKKGNQCQAVIPAEYTKTRYPMEYYFAIDMGEAGKAIFPGLDANQANMPYFVIRQFDAAISNKKPSEVWSPLFNGISLDGWHVACLDDDKGKNFWQVTEGTIECNSMGNPEHDYIWLCTDKEYDDFELTLKFT